MPCSPHRVACRRQLGGSIRRVWRELKRLFPLTLIVVLMVTSGPRFALAEDLALPASVEAQLTGKVARYDRNFAARVVDKVVIAIVSKPGDADSERAASQIQAAFGEVGPIAGFPHEEFIVRWTDANALAAVCAQRRAVIVFLTPGLNGNIESIAKALENPGMLLVAGSLSYVEQGAVLGFDLVSGRPKLVISLSNAKRQGISFRSSLLDLARVIP